MKKDLKEYQRIEKKNRSFCVRVTSEQYHWVINNKLSATRIFTKALEELMVK